MFSHLSGGYRDVFPTFLGVSGIISPPSWGFLGCFSASPTKTSPGFGSKPAPSPHLWGAQPCSAPIPGQNNSPKSHPGVTPTAPVMGFIKILNYLNDLNNDFAVPELAG